MLTSLDHKVLLTKDIWDDGEDHHPPGYIAYAGEVLSIRSIRNNGSLSVYHDGNDGSFVIYDGEFELIPLDEEKKTA